MWLKSFLGSSIGSKTLMALTGLALSGFATAHLAGNLILYAGQDAFNTYAAAMQHNPLLWPARIGLLVIFTLHVSIGIRLSQKNRAARPVKYAHPATIQASKASLSMIYTGCLLLAYILYHLAHFTLHIVNHTEHGVDSQGRHDAYTMVVNGFSDPMTSILYIVAMVLLALHLSHGFSSLWQSLGIRHPKYKAALRLLGPAFAIAVATGFISIPVSVMLGVIK